MRGAHMLLMASVKTEKINQLTKNNFKNFCCVQRNNAQVHLYQLLTRFLEICLQLRGDGRNCKSWPTLSGRVCSAVWNGLCSAATDGKFTS